MLNLKQLENHFELITSTTEFNKIELEQLDKDRDQMLDMPYLLVHLTDRKNYAQLDQNKVAAIAEYMTNMEGSFVLVLDEYDTQNADQDWVIVPSYDEGIDYIFMEKIEKDILGDFGE